MKIIVTHFHFFVPGLGLYTLFFPPHILHVIVDEQLSRKSTEILDQYHTVNISIVVLAGILQIPVLHILFLILLYVYISFNGTKLIQYLLCIILISFLN